MQLNKLKIITLDEVTSTNDYLKEHYKSLDHFTILRTNYQKKGRGQFERVWESEKNKNLIFSILLKNIEVDIKKIRDLLTNTLLDILSKYNINARFKEPNDIYVNQKKLLGILIETKINIKNHYEYIILGVGININQKVFQNENATSLNIILKKEIEINDIFTQFISEFMKNYKLI